MDERKKELRYKLFSASGTLFSSKREDLTETCEEALLFANRLSPEDLVSVSHSESYKRMPTVTVWYWA